jgi:hypothetical protein
MATTNTSFISMSTPTPNHHIVTINGRASEAKKTRFYDGEHGVQLSRAQTSESNFDWHKKNIKEVVLDNIIVYDESDVQCLVWFIHQSIKINMSKGFVSEPALSMLIRDVTRLVNSNVRVIEGSSIRLPYIGGGFREYSTTEEAATICQQIGFKVLDA